MKSLKLLRTTFIAALTFGVVGSAYADWWYFDTPSFYSNAYPNEIGCRIGGNLSIEGLGVVNCFPEEVTESFERVTIKTSDGQILVETIDVITIADCSGGTCVDIRNNAYLGKLDFPKDSPVWKGLDMKYIKLLKGYYLSRHPERGVAMVYRNGTGPMADNFPPALIENDHDAFYNQAVMEESVPSEQSAPSSSETIYDLWCNPRGDFCDYTDNQGVDYRLSRDELADYIPIAEDASDCYMEVCHNVNMDVIGLNPNYHLFR